MVLPAIITGVKALTTALGGAQIANWFGFGGGSDSGPSTTMMLAIAAVAILLLVVVLRG